MVLVICNFTKEKFFENYIEIFAEKMKKIGRNIFQRLNAVKPVVESNIGNIKKLARFDHRIMREYSFAKVNVQSRSYISFIENSETFEELQQIIVQKNLSQFESFKYTLLNKYFSDFQIGKNDWDKLLFLHESVLVLNKPEHKIENKGKET